MPLILTRGVWDPILGFGFPDQKSMGPGPAARAGTRGKGSDAKGAGAKGAGQGQARSGRGTPIPPMAPQDAPG